MLKSSLPIPVRELLKRVEEQRVEYKSGWDVKAETARKVVETICAFANDYLNLNGGYLVLGVEDDGNGRAVLPPKGLAPDRLEEVQRQVTGLCRKLLHPEYQPILSVEEVDGRHLLAIWAPASRSRPHSCAESRKDPPRFFVRMGAETRVARGETLHQLHRMTSRVPYDDDVAAGYSFADLSPSHLREFLHQTGRKDLLEIDDDAEVYRLLGLTVKVNDHEAPKNAALLFFHREPQTIFRGASIRFAYFRDGAGGDLIEEKNFVGPLHHQIRDCLQHLGNRRTDYILKLDGRPEAAAWADFPERAVEEVVVNALHHRDYKTSRDPTLVRLYPDSLQVTSYPGPEPGLRAEDFQPGRPVQPPPARNRLVGDVLRRIRLVEQHGSGVPKIYQAMEQNGSPPPRFDFNEVRFTVILPARRETETAEPARSPQAPLRTTGPRSRGVFGRDKDVRKLAQLVAERPLVSVYGLTGVGKTTLVEELRHTTEHAGVRYHTVRISEETTFKGLFQQLAPALGAGTEGTDERLAAMSRFTVLTKWTKQAAPTLIHLERADLLLDDTGERFRDHQVGDFLTAIAEKCGDVCVVLEGRRAPGKDIFAADVHAAMRVGGLGKDDLDAFFRMPHRSHAVVWELADQALGEVFERLGGGRRRKGKAHPLGMVLLASLAAARGGTPYDVVRHHPDAFAEALEKGIFHDLYDVLDDTERHLLCLCALYRNEIPLRHVVLLLEHVGDSDERAFDALLDRCLLRSDIKEERFSLNRMIADLVRRRLETKDDVVIDGHHRIGELWLADAKGLRRLPQILATSEAVHHLVLGQGWELLAGVQGRLLLQDDVVAELRAVSHELHRRHRHQEHRRVLELLVASDDSDIMSHRFLAEAIEKLEGRGAAAAFVHYEKAYDLGSDHPANVNNLMRYLEKRDPQRCVAIGEKAIADSVAADHVYAVMAKALEELGREDEASALRRERLEAGTPLPRGDKGKRR